jgi:hypothetical protein
MLNNTNTFVRLALCAAFGFAAFSANAAIVYSSNVNPRGNWNVGANWSNNGGSGTNKYVVQAGDTIDLTANVTNVDTLWIRGVLYMGNNRTITINSGGTVILDWGGVIMGGSNNSRFIFTGSSYQISGPFTTASGNLITNGPRWATATSTTAALGNPQGSFIGLPTLLPVDLASINVEKDGNNFNLTWTALAESNQNLFTVEVSDNGKDFSIAGYVAGNKELHEGDYLFTISGKRNSFYIRLSETNNTTGNKSILAVKYVNHNTINVDAFQFYPNLISSAGQSVNMVLPTSGKHSIMVYSMDMKVAAESTATTYSSNESITFNSAMWNLKTGYYVVVVTDDNGQVHRTKISVQ